VQGVFEICFCSSSGVGRMIVTPLSKGN
jgi:hypothetical protein